MFNLPSCGFGCCCCTLPEPVWGNFEQTLNPLMPALRHRSGAGLPTAAGASYRFQPDG
jgi:hypothetical protein